MAKVYFKDKDGLKPLKFIECNGMRFEFVPRNNTEIVLVQTA